MSNTTWPPPSGLTTQFVPGKDAVLEVHHSVTINAPAADVFETLLHAAEYEKWNSWIPEVRILKQDMPQDPNVNPGDFSHMTKNCHMDFHVIMNDSKPESKTTTALIVSDISTPEKPSDYIDQETLDKEPSYTSDLSSVYRVSWKSCGGLGPKVERFHEVIVRGPNQCEVRTWEIMGGILAYAVKFLYAGFLQEKFKTWCEDLKKYSEQKAQAAST